MRRGEPVKRDADTVVDRALGALEEAKPSLAGITPANVVELAWALRGMRTHDSVAVEWVHSCATREGERAPALSHR
jgi:hypothetical protein